MVDFPAGILLVGGDVDNLSAPLSVEFWSKQGSCVLPDYPRQMPLSPSVNLVADQLVQGDHAEHGGLADTGLDIVIRL